MSRLGTVLPALDYGSAAGDSSDSSDSSDSERENAVQTTPTRAPLDPTLASKKLALAARCFALDGSDVPPEARDASTLFTACANGALSESEFREACEERARTTRACGWPPCARERNARVGREVDRASSKYEIDGAARVVRATSWTSSFCSRECVLEAEACGRRLGARGRALSATEGAARWKGSGEEEKPTVVKAEVSERGASSGDAVKPSSAADDSSKLAAMTSAATVDGYVPRAARKAIERERQREKGDADAKASVSTVSWNEGEIQEIEREMEERKTKASAVDEPAGVFYFDTYGEGQKKPGEPEEGFVPSIGGRFAEGQLRTEPRTVADDAAIAARAMEKLVLAEEEASRDAAAPAAPEDVGEVTRKMLASTLTSKPIPGFFDDDDEDDDVEGEGTDLSSDDDDAILSAAPKISQFGVTWMAVDNLVTEATFALVAGDGTFVDMLPPRNKYTVSVSDAWNENLAKTVPELCASLNISAERRRIEQNLTTLLRTFAFDRPVPAFTRKRWLMMTLLFVETLIDADLLSREAMGEEVFGSANATAIFADADATSEEVALLRQRLRGQGVRD